MAISEKFKAPDHSFKNMETKDRLVFSVFNGNLYMTVWSGSGTKQHDQKLQLGHQVAFKSILTEALTASPGTKTSMKISTFDFKGTKTWIPSTVIVLEKDNEQIFTMHIQAPKGDSNNTYSFKMTASLGIAINGENMTKANASLLALKTFISWLEGPAIVGEVLTREKYTGNFNKGGQGTQASTNEMPF